MMDISLLTQADFVLDKCGRPRAPKGLSIVYIPKGFSVNVFFPITPSTATQTVTKEITGDTNWCLRDMQIFSTTATAISLQVQLPNGRFLISNLQDCLQIAGYGSYRYLFTKELECEPGSKIMVTFQDTNTGVAQPLFILFGGAYKYLMKSSAGQICPVETSAMQIPRVLPGPSQNIMAPCWQQGVGPPTPKGYEDMEFVYSTNPAVPTTALPLAGPFNATQVIPIDSASDFRCRKLLFVITADSGVTAGSVLVKVRTGSGYSLFDDYFDAATYINSAPMPIDWRINAADNVYLDLELVDSTGSGNVYFQAYLEGVKRWRKAA
jgi:hypothetical protein